MNIEKKGISKSKTASILNELPEGTNKEVVRIAELRIHGKDALDIAEELGLSVQEVVAMADTKEYYQAEQMVMRYLGKTYSNKVIALYGEGLDVLGDILASPEATDKNKLSAFNTIAKLMIANAEVVKHKEKGEHSHDDKALEGLSMEDLNKYSKFTKEAEDVDVKD